MFHVGVFRSHDVAGTWSGNGIRAAGLSVAVFLVVARHAVADFVRKKS